MHLTKEGDIAAVQGRVVLRIPTGTTSLVFNRSGQKKSWGGGTIVVKKFSGKKVELSTTSIDMKKSLIGFLNVDNSGHRARPQSSFSGHLNVSNNPTWSYTLQFKQPVKALHLFLKEGKTVQTLPFNLNWEQNLILPLPASISTETGTTIGSTAGASEDVSVLSDHAYKLYQSGNYEQSILLLDTVIQAEPSNAWAWYTRGWSKWKLNNKPAARADMAEACKFNYLDACSLKNQ